MNLARRAAAGSHEFRRGFVDTLPLWLGVAPFGIAYAVAARTAGLSDAETMAMSILVFAGASQFTATGLFATGAGWISIVLTTLIVNLRHLLLTASLAPALRFLPAVHRAALAFGVTDEVYAVTVRRVSEGEAGPGLVLGSSASLYVCWQGSTLAGLALSAAVPDPAAWGLDLVFPLSFLVLLAPYLRRRPAFAAAAVAAAVAVAARLSLPASWYVLAGAVTGSLVGALLERDP